MDATSIYYKSMVDAVTYDGYMLFGNDCRHLSNYSSGRLFGLMNFTKYCEMVVMSDEKYRATVEEAQRIHSVAGYISVITDDYISLDEKLQELDMALTS